LEVLILSSHARCFGLLATGVVLLAGWVGPASGSPETLKRSVSNILMGPLDVVFTPVVAARSVYTNLQNVDDTMGVRVAYALPGYVWNMGVQIAGGTVRVIAGAIEFLPGLGLFFFDADLDPLFAPADKSAALVDYDTPPLNFKFGITYTE
jgi:hypothetical protein